jgi:hypothetical protein
MRPIYEDAGAVFGAVKTVSDLLTLAGKGMDGEEEFDTDAAKKAASIISAGRTSRDKYSYSSVASAASKLIAIFPILCSRTVSRETANMVQKYIEQQGCMMLQLALQQANISSAKNGIEYLRQFHQNLRVGSNGLDALGDVLNTYAGSLQAQNSTSESTSVSGQMYNDKVMESIVEALGGEANFESDDSIQLTATQMNGLLEMFADAEKFVVYDTKLNPVSIQDYMVKESVDGSTYGVIVKPLNEISSAGPEADYEFGGYYDDLQDPNRGKEASGYDYYKRNKELDRDKEADKDRARKEAEYRRQQSDRYKQDRDRHRQEKERAEDRAYTMAGRKQQKEDRERQKREHDEDRAYTMSERQRQEDERRRQEQEKLNRKHNVTFLKDQDIKKMNNALPSLLLIRFYSKDTSSVATEFIIGVKAKLVGCDSTEILRRIANDNTDGKFFINLMRTITGELKKSDFLFGLSRTYEDLASTKRKGALGDIWALLKNRALASKEAVRSGKGNNYSAITTVIISRDDAEDLFREENLDVSDVKVAKHFLSSYNLLGFAICDDSTETLRLLLDDGSNVFDEIHYSMLERETQDGNYKKLVSLIANNK